MIRKLAFATVVTAAGLAAAFPVSAAMTWAQADAVCKPGFATAGYMDLPDDSGGNMHCHPRSAQYGGAKPTLDNRKAAGYDVSGMKLVKLPTPKAAPATAKKAKAKT